MKKILVFLAFCLALTVSQAQKFIEYPFYADGVVEFGYLVDEDIYYIIYRDTTNFPDFTIYDDWEEETYLIIDCEEDDFFDYLSWFAEEKVKKSELFYKRNEKYAILEIVTEVKGGNNYQYKLIKDKQQCIR